MMLERRVVVSHEAIRLWSLKFGGDYARRLRHGRGRCSDTRLLDEVFCKVNGKLVYPWWAVNQEGEVLDILVQSRRNARAAKRFFRELRTGLRYNPRRLVTDKLPSYTSAHREIIPETERCRGGRLNNRAKNFHQPTRERERRMQKFKSMKQAQRFLSTNG